MNLDLAVNGGSVELAESAFAREYNEALVHSKAQLGSRWALEITARARFEAT